MPTTARVVALVFGSDWAWCAVEERVPGREVRVFSTIIPKEKAFVTYDDGTEAWEYGTPAEHQYPLWMSFRTHITLERVMYHVPGIFFRNPITSFLYDFIYGLLCCYPLIDILRWSIIHRLPRRTLARME